MYDHFIQLSTFFSILEAVAINLVKHVVSLRHSKMARRFYYDFVAQIDKNRVWSSAGIILGRPVHPVMLPEG